MKKPLSAVKYKEPAENSIIFRLVVFVLGLVNLAAGCSFVATPWPLLLSFLFVAACGSYLSYRCRAKQMRWQSYVVVIGIFLVAMNSLYELLWHLDLGEQPYSAAVLHFFVGTWAVHTFELRSRSDLNQTGLLGIIIFCFAAWLGKSLLFAVYAFLYVALGAVMLYYDCLSRTSQAWLARQTQAIELTPIKRKTVSDAVNFHPGNRALVVASLPLACLIIFLFLPRADAFIDETVAYLRSLMAQPQGLGLQVVASQKQSDKPWHAPARKNTANLHNHGSKHGSGLPLIASQEQSNMARRALAGKKPAGAGAADSHMPPNPNSNHDRARSERSKLATQKSAAKQSRLPPAKGNAKNQTATENAVPGDDDLNIQTQANQSDQLLFKMRSARTVYCRMFAFDTFDGSIWTASDREANVLKRPAQGAYQLSDVKSLEVPSALPAISLNQEYWIERELNRNLPLTWIPASVAVNYSQITVDNYGAVRIDGNLKKGAHFKATSQMPVYDLQKMLNEPELDQIEENELRAFMPQYLQVPANLSDRFISLSEQIQSVKGNWFAKAQYIRQYLRSRFTYTVQKQRAECPVDQFLFVRKAGDCKDFATSEALLCRAIGIPARVVAGYAPGKVNPISGLTEVRVKHRHVWSEIYIPHYGWVPFDATPQGSLPDKLAEQAFNIDSIRRSLAADDTKPKPDRNIDRKDVDRKVVDSPLQVNRRAETGGFVLAAIASLIGIFVAYKLLKRSGIADAKKHAAMKFMEQVEKDLKRWRVERAPSDTCTEFSARLKSVVDERQRLHKPVNLDVINIVDEFLENYSAAYFGNKDRNKELEKLANDIHNMLANSRPVR